MMIGIQTSLPKYLRMKVEILAKREKKSISKIIGEIVAKEMKERLRNAL